MTYRSIGLLLNELHGIRTVESPILLCINIDDLLVGLSKLVVKLPLLVG